MKFLLSVDPTGLVSLWDTVEQRMRGMGTDEIPVDMLLTPEQEKQIQYISVVEEPLDRN